MLSRILGLARDVLMAGAFGTSPAMNAFVLAFTVPNLFRRLFGEGALSSAFIPTFIKAREQEGTDAAWKLARKIITLTALVLSAFTLLGIACARALEWLPWDGPDIPLTLNLLQIMLPYMIFICLAAITMGILNSLHHFAVPAATPCILNICVIVAIIWLAPVFGDTAVERIYGVAWGILIAGILQFAVQLPMLIKQGFTPGIDTTFKDPKVIKVITLMIPAALGAAVTQVNVLVDRLLAASIGNHAAPALFFSERLIYLPLGIFATAMGTVLLPVFSGQVAKDDHEEIPHTINHSVRILLFVMVPAAMGLLILARPIIELLFQWKEFTAESTDFTTAALQFYAPGLIVFSLAKVFIPVFYAHQDTKTPVKIGLCTVALNILLNLLFVFTWPYEIKHAGLACATVISETFQVVVLALILQRRYGSPGWLKVFIAASRFLFAAVCMGFVVLYGQRYLANILPGSFGPSKAPLAIALFSSILMGTISYVAIAGIFRFPELTEAYNAARRRKKTKAEVES